MSAALPRVFPPPPMPKRESVTKRLALASLLAFASALGGAVFSGTHGWVGGIATRGYVDQTVQAEVALARDAVTDEVTKAIDATAERVLKEVRIGNTMQLERVGVEIRESVGYRVALHEAIEPRRRATAQRAAVNARAKYDELVLRDKLTPEQARARVYELAGVPR